MKGPLRGGMAAGLVLLAFYSLGYFITSALGLQGRFALIAFWAVFGILGAAAGFIVYRLTTATSTASPKEPAAEDLAFDQAKRKLKAQEGRGPGRVPLLLVVGPEGSAKTTTVLRAGVGAELLAGEDVRGDQPIPTDTVNLWYGQQTLFVEVSPRVISDEDRWARLIQRVQPARLAAAVGRGEQAPRSVVVCLSCEDFLQPGASRSVPETAARYRQKLGELAQAVGIRLPVYVVFTKADRLPYFGDYVRNLTDSEAQEILGVTLPVQELGDPSDHVPRQTKAIRSALQTVFEGLARRRVGMLDREHASDARLGAYEFPREFLKIADPATQFLVELCRPVQLGVSPFLRGFYFTGVRPVFIRDSGGAPSRPAAPQPPAGATSVFDAGQLARAAQTAPSQGGGRKVPQWVFLGRLFRDVVLADEVAQAVTSGGRRVDGMRRLVAGGAAALLLLAAFGMTVSFFGNTALARDAVEAVQAAGPISQASSEEEVEALELLRTRTEEIGALREDRPLRLGFGLRRTARIHDALRAQYFDRFRSALWEPARAVLLRRLRSVSADPGAGAAYQPIYDDLRVYLAATERPDLGKASFMTPVLFPAWRQGRTTTTRVDSLVTLQFDFLARELARSEPYEEAPDFEVVEHARRVLDSLSTDEQLYEFLLTDASASFQSVEIARPGFLTVDSGVPGAFTTPGWEAIQARLDVPGDLVAGEAWVLGDGRARPEAELSELAAELRTRYEQDYVSTWSSRLSRLSVTTFGLGNARSILGDLADPRNSPLLGALNDVAANTAVDSVVASVFQPVHLLAPPSESVFAGDAAPDFLASLANLGDAMDALDQALGAGGDGAVGAASDAQNEANAASRVVQQIAGQFASAPEARVVGDAVEALLVEPIERARSLAVGAPGAAERVRLNGAASAFCRTFSEIQNRYPFAPGDDATVADVNRVLGPEDGELSSLVDALDGVIEGPTGDFRRAQGAPVRAGDAFLGFLNRASTFSDALYQYGADPEIRFVVDPDFGTTLQRVVLLVGNARREYTPTVGAQGVIRWSPLDGAGAELQWTDNAGASDRRAREGSWALFKLFHSSESSTRLTDTSYRFDWPEVTITVEGSTALQLFQRSFFSNFQCVDEVTR